MQVRGQRLASASLYLQKETVVQFRGGWEAPKAGMTSQVNESGLYT